MHSRLLTFERHLEHISAVNSVNTSFANIAISTNSSGFGASSSQTSKRPPSRNHGQHSHRGSHGRSGFDKSRPTCQVCTCHGHTALECFYRFDKSYGLGDQRPRQNSSAYVATPGTLSNPDWYMNSGATNHITHHDVPGPSEKGNLTVGNGSKLWVRCAASASLNSNDSDLSLKPVLVVPEIKKNLVSVAELTNDNDVVVEFDASSCFVKDKQTHKVLLTGKMHNGLYKIERAPSFPVSNEFVVFLSVLDHWHRKLGHPSFETVKNVLRDCNVSVPTKDKFTFCDACKLGKSHALPFKRSDK